MSMKISAVTSLCLAFCLALPVFGDEPGQAPAPASGPAKPAKVPPAAGEAPAIDEQAMMQAWMALATPGPEHAGLAKLAGKFDAAIKVWEPMKPGSEPTSAGGTMVFEPILGGRYMHGTYKGVFMGMPFEGGLLWGFANAKKKYQSVWVDSMGTEMMVSEGTSADNGKTIISTAKMFGPGPDGKLMEYTQREKIVIESPDKFSATMWHVYPQGDVKVMEIVYTRAVAKREAKGEAKPEAKPVEAPAGPGK